MEQLVVILVVFCFGNCMYAFSEAYPADAPSTCFSSWLPYNGSCYYFGRAKMTFTSAAYYCSQRHFSHLVHIKDASENEFIKDIIQTDSQERFWWVGLTDENSQNKWQWFGTDDLASFFDWVPGHPTHQSNECAALSPSTNFQWIDTACSHIYYPICENIAPIESEVVGK